MRFFGMQVSVNQLIVRMALFSIVHFHNHFTTMKALSHSYLTEPATGLKNYLQNQILLLQQQMMELRRTRNFDELENLEQKVDHLHRRMKALV